jgi:hypothetical protein
MLLTTTLDAPLDAPFGTSLDALFAASGESGALMS